MNKGLFSFFIIFIALFVGAFYFTDVVQSPFVSTLNYIKITYKDSVNFVQKKIDMHFFQAQHIDDLNKKLQKYENNHLVMHELAYEVNDLFKLYNSSFKSDPRVELTRVISYEKFGNFNHLWLEIKDYNSSKIYGLVYKELVAGIVISQNNKALGLLNKDIKSSYAVIIGDTKAPGIVHGNNSQNLIINFIPAWFDIKEGDEVVTSGLDNIFFKGLKVGKVVSVSSSQGYQNAVVKPYYNSADPNYFYLIRRVR